jgi:pimeloyl-ACP methyl ester carboxylesterase
VISRCCCRVRLVDCLGHACATRCASRLTWLRPPQQASGLAWWRRRLLRRARCSGQMQQQQQHGGALERTSSGRLGRAAARRVAATKSPQLLVRSSSPGSSSAALVRTNSGDKGAAAAHRVMGNQRTGSSLAIHSQGFAPRSGSTKGPDEASPCGPVADFRPRSTATMKFKQQAVDSDDAELVEAFATTFGAGDADLAGLLRRIQPHRARTKLGAHGREWDIHCWALPAAPSAGADAAPPVALCMHGHGHSCCVTSWARFFKPLHDAGFHVLALDAPCFGRSGGTADESGNARLWNLHDAELVVRLLQSFGVKAGSQRCTAFAQCMGAAMFMRALVLAPDLFGPFHVMHNATIGSFPPQIADILTAKGGKLLAYHEVDADHMREAVCYKKLTALMQHAPHLCRYVDNELARAANDPDHMNSEHQRVSTAQGAMLTRTADGSCFYFEPSALVLGKVLSHVTAGARPPPSAAQLRAPVESAVALGTADVNFKVAVRVRPPIEREQGIARSYTFQPAATADVAQKHQELVTLETCVGIGETRSVAQEFAFTRVLGEDADNATVFSDVALPLIDFVLAELEQPSRNAAKRKQSGPRSATMFAYGQTGSGKTHTISGTPIEPGVIPRMIDELYRRVGATAGTATTITCSYIQLYNEALSELLGGAESAGRPVSVREQQDAVELVDARLCSPPSAAVMKQLLAEAAKHRATSATAMNEVSSRSHSLLTLRVGKLAVIHIVDLAGSEKVKKSLATGGRFDEAVSINKSLLALGLVVNALTAQDESGAVGRSNRRHIPYRGSMLTRLLANALGGNSRTALVACISPTADSANESLGTLRFAARATHIKNAVECEDEPEPELSESAVEALDGVAQAVATFDPFATPSRACVVKLGPFDGGTARGGRRAAKKAKPIPVEVFGDFAAGLSAPVVVCLHYYGAGSEGGANFVEWFRPLREAGFRVLAPSFPGHGSTPGPPPSAKPDAEVLAGAPRQFVGALLDHFGIKKCVIMGHDWGGGVAFEFAARTPQRVLAVIGHSISFRSAEASLAILQKRYGGKQKKLLLCWVESQVHLKDKGRVLAKLAGVKLKEANDWDGVLQHVTRFLTTLRQRGS